MEYYFEKCNFFQVMAVDQVKDGAMVANGAVEEVLDMLVMGTMGKIAHLSELFLYFGF